MRIEEIWWKHLTNPSGFAESIIDSVLDGMSSAVIYKKDIPWKEDFIQNILFEIERESPNMKTDIHRISGYVEPDEYIMHRYCGEKERSLYWGPRDHSKAKFLSKSSRSTLNKSNVIIDITDADNTDEWIDFVEEYTSYFSDEEEHGVFLLLMHDTDISGISNIRCFDYDKYIHDFDVFMLCMTILASQNCSIQKKQYISEIAVSLAKDNVVVAGQLAEYKGSLPVNISRIAEKVFKENGLSCDDIAVQIKTALWEAQVKILFPIIEQFRSKFIEINYDKLRRYKLDAYKANNVFELEIGQLYHLCYGHGIFKKELNFLEKVRNARNSLAHLEFVPQGDVDILMSKCLSYPEE